MNQESQRSGEPSFVDDTSADWGAPGIGLVDQWSRGAWERIEGFKRASEIVAEHTEGESEPISDWLVYPVLFLYRHTIELRLKYAIVDGYAYLNDDSHGPPHGHDLEHLWAQFQEVVEHCGVGRGADWSQCEGMIRLLQGVDTPSAEAFRYPYARDGVTELPSTEKMDRVDFRSIRHRCEQLLDTLEGWESALEASREARGMSS